MLKALSNLVATPKSVQAASDADGSQRRRLFHVMEEHGRGVRLDDDEYFYEQKMANMHLVVHKLGIYANGTPDSPGHLGFDVNYDGGHGGVSVRMTSEVIQQAVAASNVTLGTEVRILVLVQRAARHHRARHPELTVFRVHSSGCGSWRCATHSCWSRRAASPAPSRW